MKLLRKVYSTIKTGFEVSAPLLAVLSIVVMVVIFVPPGNTPAEYTIVYEVYWTPTKSEVFTKTNHKGYYVGSDRGTNFIKEGSITGPQVIKTSAPIRIISYTSKELRE